MKIALLEDEEQAGQMITLWLNESGHEVNWFKSGLECMRTLQNKHYDLYIFDWILPDINGLEVMEHLKLKGALPPVIFITQRSSEEDVAQILKAGADDYIVKPPSKIILLARIDALLRRYTSKVQMTINYGRLSVNFVQQKVKLDGIDVKLTDKETYLALYLFKYIGTLVSRTYIAQVIWGHNAEVNSRTIDVHICHLREKLKLTPDNGWRLNCINRQGYRLEQIEF